MQASGVYDWLRGELTVFTSAAKDNEEFVKDYLIPHYAPKVTPQMTRCWVSRDCDVSPSPYAYTLVSLHLYIDHIELRGP